MRVKPERFWRPLNVGGPKVIYVLPFVVEHSVAAKNTQSGIFFLSHSHPQLPLSPFFIKSSGPNHLLHWGGPEYIAAPLTLIGQLVTDDAIVIVWRRHLVAPPLNDTVIAGLMIIHSVIFCQFEQWRSFTPFHVIFDFTSFSCLLPNWLFVKFLSF